jgi:hypothetical protein
MSRSGYTDDCESDWTLICWRGAVKRAINGRRGQAFLKEMLAALDAMPEKRLIRDELIDADGAVCAVGAVGKARGCDMTAVDPHDYHSVAGLFGVSRALVQEIEYENDEGAGYWREETPEQRFSRVRRWVGGKIV